MAQNERESAQVVIVAGLGRPARNVAWAVRASRDAGAGPPRWDGALEVDVRPYGVVHQGPCPFDAFPEGACPPEQPWFCAQGVSVGRPGSGCRQNATRYNPNTTVGCSTTSDCCAGRSSRGRVYH